MVQETAHGPRRTRRPNRLRPLRWCALVMVLLVVAVGSGIVRLASGPLRIEGLSEQVTAAIASRIGPGWRVALRDSALQLDAERSLALEVKGLDVINPEGALVMRAPAAVVSIDTWSLLRLSVQPRSIEFRDLQMTALVHRDGSIAFAAASPGHPGEAQPHTLPSVDAARGVVSPLSASVASIFGIVLDSAGVVGALDRARITNGKLTLIDDDARERAVFDRVNALFSRDVARNARIFELRIDGPHGEWRLGGNLQEAAGDLAATGGDPDETDATLRTTRGARRSGVITLDDLPVTDFLLLSGQSKLPVTTDLKLSAKADVVLDGGRIESMRVGLHTGGGNLLIEEKDFNPVTIESLRAAATWDEAARSMQIEEIDYRGAGNAVRLAGAWTAGPAGAETDWSLALSGRDAVLRGATPKDQPVAVAKLDARLVGRAGGITIDDLTMEAGGGRGRITGSIGTAADDDGLTLHITAGGTDGRTALRLWPEHVAPPARNYLVDNLRGGKVEAVDIVVDMSAAELASATRGEPMPDNAVNIRFSVADAVLGVSPDAPPLSQGRATGTITGQSTTIKGVTAEIRMADNRSLAISDGSFVIKEITPDKVVAQIGLKLGGGADGLAALLQTKMFKSVTGADIEPANVKGHADLRIDFPLDLKNMPDLADLPATMTGTLTDLSYDKAFGKDRLDAGRFTVAYDRNGFTLKGDGKVAGAPLTVDLRQPKAGGVGEVLVNLSLDEALRARKGMPVAPQLSGSIPTRITVPIGRSGPAKSHIRVEADLTKAGIDVTGLVKSAGKAGRLTFTMVDGGQGGGMELRDMVLDAAPGSARGNVVLSADGGLERVELSSLKLSPGDDMRLQAERAGAGYKLVVKGQVADARPFLKSLGGPDGKPSKDGAVKDVDADVTLAIVTGFNGEVLTGATFRVTTKGKDIRSAQFAGKFRGTPFQAQISRGERGVPTLAVEAADAGATLRFADIYRRMYGGSLSMSSALNDGPQAGVVRITNFTLRNEPALSSIIAQGPTTSEVVDSRGRKQVVQGQGSEVSFDRLRANFTRTGSRVDFTDAAISNAAMGFTLSGFLDTSRERTDVKGTFVPLYGLNNVVSQLPLFGQLLGGGNNEGLFALNFRVSGRLTSPDVSVNPLSALAPGILRKLFSAGGEGPETTGNNGQRGRSDGER
ncbi:hypothetical protein ASG59_02690 [Methylobacterium sp. Leaf466]|nr:MULTISPECIES: DUF3971 domain-containing protein [unclassified Methylobacterium]KQP52600.1 hypothetical protein ASF39_06705 [Methylobacterium sp. Leaf108]KQT84313.1 hypothetical protein ASG59_02690 [Methylobacterium sp. Leaf466]